MDSYNTLYTAATLAPKKGLTYVTRVIGIKCVVRIFDR